MLLCSLFKHSDESWVGNGEATCTWMQFGIMFQVPLDFKVILTSLLVARRITNKPTRRPERRMMVKFLPEKRVSPFVPAPVLNARVILTSPNTARSGVTPRPATVPLTRGRGIGGALSLGPWSRLACLGSRSLVCMKTPTELCGQYSRRSHERVSTRIRDSARCDFFNTSKLPPCVALLSRDTPYTSDAT